MNAFRQILKRKGNTVSVELPENFVAEEVEVIVLPHTNSDSPEAERNVEELRNAMREAYKGINVDLSNFKFNRDELYDRP